MRSFFFVLHFAVLFCAFNVAAATHLVDFEQTPGPKAVDCLTAPRVVKSDGATVSGGGVFTNVFGFSGFNATSVYYTATDESPCGYRSLLTIDFDLPASAISLDLIHGEYEDRTYLFADDQGNVYPVTMSGKEALRTGGVPQTRVTLPFQNTRRVTISNGSFFSPLWAFAIDNIRFETPDVTVTFDITNSTLPERRRVLIHKFRSDDDYRASQQTADGRIRIRAQIAPQIANVKVYFRVIDPPDPSSYVPVPDRKLNDNAGLPGSLSAQTAVTDGSGYAEPDLIVSEVAGDNYEVEASIDPSLITPAGVCGAGCGRSGTLTAWKRVYVEMNRMAKKGAFITEPVRPGDRKIRVSDVRAFAEGDRVQLLHAPPVEGTGAFYDAEIVTVRHVEGRKKLSIGRPEPGTLLLYDPNLTTPSGDVVSNRYERPEDVDGRERPYLADAVVQVTGNANNDSYTMSSLERQLVRPLFEEAFTETMFLVDDPEFSGGRFLDIQYDGVVPFYDNFALKDPDNKPDTQREWFGRKWMRNGGRAGPARTALPNHQVVFLAARDRTASSFGATNVADGFNDTWLFLDSIGSAPLAREALVHELTHQWLVNQVGTVPDGHCDTPLTVGTTRFMVARPRTDWMCSMTNGEILYKTQEATDGVVGFHYVTMANGQVDSEYLHIRRRRDPIPQNEKTIGRNPK